MADIRRKGKVQVAPGQPPKDAELMNVQESSETWSHYRLDDGTTLRVKAVALEIWRVENEFDAEGNPVYALKSQPIMTVDAPENLKKKSS